MDELCKGNFISTQSILVKKKIIEKVLFDIRIILFYKPIK